jgi:hypothetical protein
MRQFAYRRAAKYKAIKQEIDGIKFDSRAEACRYQVLKMLQQAGQISNLVLQPTYRLMDGFSHNGKTIRPIDYRADFKYIENGIETIEDVKGFSTPDYLLKAKLFIKCYLLGTNKKYYLIHNGQRKEF